MSDPISGVGTLFRRWNSTLNGSTGGWENIAHVSNISGPDKSRETIDVTALDTVGGYRKFIGSFRDAGQVQIGLFFTREGLDLMNADYESDDIQHYEIVLPDSVKTSIEFAGLVTNLPLNIVPDDKVTINVTFKVSGKPVVNSGSGSGSGTV